MRPRAEEKRPRALLEERLASAEREAIRKSEQLVRATARGVGVAYAELEEGRTAKTRDKIADELDKIKEGEQGDE